MSIPWYQRSVEETLQLLATDAGAGLSQSEAQRRLQQYGYNELIERGRRTPQQILIEQFSGILTLILIGAALISVFLSEYVDAIVILAIVMLNAALGFFQEYRAEQSMAALKRMAVPTVRVRREGRVQEISARELVPGDIVLLETGNVVPADGRVLKSINLRLLEAALTGESEAVDKEASLVFETERALGDRRNMLFMGTIVNYGHGEMIVCETGMRTQLGQIADMIQSVTQEKTPLQQRLDRLGKSLAAAALVIVALVFLIGILQGNPIELMLLTAVSLAVAAIPEAMTAVVTIALSLGAQRMLKRNALIRKLPAVETLGSVNVICSDKTGTLTLNRMTVTVLDIANHRIDLEQDPESRRAKLRASQPISQGVLPTIDLLLISGALANDAILTKEEEPTPHYSGVGDPTEVALVLAAAEFGILKPDLDTAFPRVAELPFDSIRKRMTTVHRTPQSAQEIPPSLAHIWERRPVLTPPPYLAFTKGAIDGMLSIASSVWVEGEIKPLDQTWRERILTAHDELAKNGMRVLGIGMRILEDPPTPQSLQNLEQDLVLVGLCGMIDPPRPEVKDAIQTCKTAGIRAVMITGDHPLTARHIARQLGMIENDRFLTGQELDRLSPEQLRQAAAEINVFARVSPQHKLQLVQAYQDQGYIVAMTGDGINDAPALKKADIGVAMGITGTDVTKEAAEMVLLDDNFATIVAAVEEGRIIFDNIRRFIKYLFSCNASEIIVMLFGPLLGMPVPLLPLQILWMNLVTDGPPALALGVEAAEKDVMKRPPFSSSESIFGHGMLSFILGMGAIMSLISLLVGYTAYRLGLASWQTLLFTTLIFSQLVVALEARSERWSLFQIGLLSNRSMAWALVITTALQLAVIYVPPFQIIFDTKPLSGVELLVAALSSLFVLVVTEIWKWNLRRKAKGKIT
mgnify:CR=1 FL=1